MSESNTHMKTISTYGFRHPKSNLPSHGLEREAMFSDAFAKAYLARARRLHGRSIKTNFLVAREIPVNGFGIADLMSVALRPSMIKFDDDLKAEEIAAQRPTIRAFEAKLQDWKKGLMQAYAYSFFSDVSILVLPAKKAKNVLAYLDRFQKLRVGLWGFDESTLAIRTHYTPRPKHAFIEKHRLLALQRVLDAVTAPPVA